MVVEENEYYFPSVSVYNYIVTDELFCRYTIKKYHSEKIVSDD